MKDRGSIVYGAAVFVRTSDGGASGYSYRSPRWTCLECGSAGHGDDVLPGSWAAAHARGHRPCPWCGKALTVLMDGATQRVHTRCSERPEPVDEQWTSAKDLLVETRQTVAEGATP